MTFGEDKISVSVVVPVYNAEKYITRCADSLLKQTLDEVEIVFVEDGSIDNSLRLLYGIRDEFQSGNTSIRVFPMEKNVGQAAARLYGINMARGKYIAFCDIDDWIDCQMLNRMYSSAVENSADVVICDFIRSNGIEENLYKGVLKEARPRVLKDIVRQRIAGSLCNKLFKHTLFDNCILYPQENMGEDLVLSFQLIWYASKIVYIPEPYYYYSINQDSTTMSRQKDSSVRRFMSADKNVKLLTRFLQDKGELGDYRRDLDVLRFKQRNLLLPDIKDHRVYSIWKDSYTDLNYKALWMRYLPLRSKARFYLTMFGCYR